MVAGRGCGNSALLIFFGDVISAPAHTRRTNTDRIAQVDPPFLIHLSRSLSIPEHVSRFGPFQ